MRAQASFHLFQNISLPGHIHKSQSSNSFGKRFLEQFVAVLGGLTVLTPYIGRFDCINPLAIVYELVTSKRGLTAHV